ncbi:MAG TPA: hypothetical protein DCX79_14775, partial [Planctomycetaceae bacterium]|nr:hypothetical protein [Planctomycetaceae bacterium]
MSPAASAPSDDNDDDLHTHRNSSPWLREIPVRPLQNTYVLTDRQLGSGGFGTVVVGRKKHLPQHVAVKRIHRDLRFSTSDQRRFVREVQLLAPLQHPNIVRVEDWGRDDEGLYIVMELIDGPNLETFCRQQQQPFSLSQLHDFTRQICSALGWAHEHGIVHRDLKPANLLLLERFHLVKLADFGMARVDPNLREGLSSSGGTAAFTFAYASPEQLRGDTTTIDGRSDLFSLGATLFHLATGRADTSRTFDFDELPASLTPLQPLLAGLLRPSPAKRLPDVAAVLQVLDEVTTSASAPIVPAVAAAVVPVDSGSDWSKILDALQLRVKDSHDTARRHLSSQRYAEAVAALEDIPQEQRHLLDAQLYQQCISLRDQVRGLEQEIDSGVKSLRFEGLRDKVQRLQQLQPWRTDLVPLLQRIPEPVTADSVKAAAAGKAATPAGSSTSVLLSAPFSA